MSSTDVTDPRHAAARRHLQGGAIGPARQLFDALLDERPDDPDLLNDAALAYAHDGDAARAEACLRRALDARPDHEAAFYNLLDLLTDQRDGRAAREVFTTYADRLPDSDDKDRYRERLGNPLPAHQGDGAPVDDRDTDTLRIAFVCGPDRKFITDIEREIGKRHEVRTAYFDGEVNLQQIQRVMDWADVTWFEWAYKILAHSSNRLRKSSRVVTRLHRWEAFQDVIHRINWSFVDTLIPTTHHIIDVLRGRIPHIDKMTDVKVISSTVDPKRFPFRERKAGFDIAYVGYLNHRKNPSLLLQCIHALVCKDDRYHLHIAGEFQNRELELYFNHMIGTLNLQDHISMDGWIEDIATWLDDKHYLILPSMHEGNPYSVLETAAMGIRPLIHTFPGADELYPNSWTFSSVSEFVEKVLSKNYDSTEYYSYTERKYNINRITKNIEHIFYRPAPPYLKKTKSLFPINTYYGHESIMKEYSGISHDTILRLSIQHGVRELPISEADPDLPSNAEIHLLCNGKAEERFGTYSENVKGVGSPFLYLTELLEPERSLRKGTLFFAAHSSVFEKVEYDIKSVCSYLKEMDDKYKPFTVCMYWTDILEGKAKLYHKNGFRTISFGHRQDPNFLVRFLKVASRYAFSMSNQPTTALLYTAAMGIKTILVKDNITYVKSQFDTKESNVRSQNKAIRFSEFFSPDVDIQQQKAFADRLLGKDQMLSKRELRSLLLRHAQ
jgi:tetratricopeptide (TPR) repeat protein